MAIVMDTNKKSKSVQLTELKNSAVAAFAAGNQAKGIKLMEQAAKLNGEMTHRSKKNEKVPVVGITLVSKLPDGKYIVKGGKAFSIVPVKVATVKPTTAIKTSVSKKAIKKVTKKVAVETVPTPTVE